LHHKSQCFKHFSVLMTNKHLFSWLLKKAISMALCTKATLFSYITTSFRPQMARYASCFTRYELCSLLEQSLPRTQSQPKTSVSSVPSVAKNPFNLRNPRLINDLRLFKALYNCRDTFTDVMSALQIDPFCSNKPNFRKSRMNVNKVLTKDYDKKTLGQRGKNKPNSNPIQTQYKPKQTQCLPATPFGGACPPSVWRVKGQKMLLSSGKCRSKAILALYPVIW